MDQQWLLLFLCVYTYTYVSIISDRICKKGSYMHTTSTQISLLSYIHIIIQSMCASIVANNSPVCFPKPAFRDMSDVYECPVRIQLSLLAVKQRLPDCKISHDLVVILSTDLNTFWAISSISESISKCNYTLCVFPATSWLLTTPDQPPLCNHL